MGPSDDPHRVQTRPHSLLHGSLADPLQAPMGPAVSILLGRPSVGPTGPGFWWDPLVAPLVAPLVVFSVPAKAIYIRAALIKKDIAKRHCETTYGSRL